jgi:site-specific recombinase XerD
MDRLEQLFQQFLRERTYINNITRSTREWYESAWKAFKAAEANAAVRPASSSLIIKADLQQFVVYLRERGVKPVSCNCWLRALNAFCWWALRARGDPRAREAASSALGEAIERVSLRTSELLQLECGQ